MEEFEDVDEVDVFGDGLVEGVEFGADFWDVGGGHFVCVFLRD